MRKLAAGVVLVALILIPSRVSAQPSIVWAPIPDDHPAYLQDADARLFCTDTLLANGQTVCEIAPDPDMYGWAS